MEKYSIGEVSSILNISRDMVRYYEKQGVIKAKRDENNNYRYYDTKDIFWLLEAIEYKSLNIHINDISSLRLNDYEKQTVHYLDQYIKEQEKELRYKQMLISRLKNLKRRYLLGSLNINNWWIDEIPAAYSIFLVHGCGDIYSRIQTNNGLKSIFQDINGPFTDSGFDVFEQEQRWHLSIEENYIHDLPIPLTDDFSYRPSYLAICSHVDIGEFGAFDLSMISSFISQCKNLPYSRNNNIPINGLLLSRGVIKKNFSRIVELRYPIIT